MLKVCRVSETSGLLLRFVVQCILIPECQRHKETTVLFIRYNFPVRRNHAAEITAPNQRVCGIDSQAFREMAQETLDPAWVLGGSKKTSSFFRSDTVRLANRLRQSGRKQIQKDQDTLLNNAKPIKCQLGRSRLSKWVKCSCIDPKLSGLRSQLN